MTNYQLTNLYSWHGGQWSKIYSLTSMLQPSKNVDRKFWIDHRDLIIGCLNELQAIAPQSDKGSAQSLTRAKNFLLGKLTTNHTLWTVPVNCAFTFASGDQVWIVRKRNQTANGNKRSVLIEQVLAYGHYGQLRLIRNNVDRSVNYN